MLRGQQGIDMTCREMLPLWLPEEAVGGKLVLPGALETQPVSDASGANAMASDAEDDA